MNNEIVGIFAGLFEVFALLLIGQFKNKWGFIVGMCCNIAWIIFAIATHSAIGLLIVCPVAFIFNSMGFSKWTKDERSNGGMADAPDSSPGVERHEGSSPSSSIKE